MGTLNKTIVHPREIFKKAIVMSCNSIIIAHNHPSDNPEPSREDKKITFDLRKAGELLDIPVVDHIIIGKDTHYSFKEEENW
jgi:DNA repair protein RadC